MQNAQNSSITLEQLQMLDYELDKEQHYNEFAIYLSANSRTLEIKEPKQFMALDTLVIPKIPLRRIGCRNCLKKNIQCQTCQHCTVKGLACCKEINCVYDFSHYTLNKLNPIYKKCPCTSKFLPSTQQFAIDWRLLSLLQKLQKTSSIQYNYFLHFTASLLWITEQQIDKQGISIKIERTIFQESFYPHPEPDTPNRIIDNNIRNISSIIKNKTKQYLNYKQDWNTSNLEEECTQIVDHFTVHKGLQELKTKLQNPFTQQQHLLLSGTPIKSFANMKNITQSQIPVDQSNFHQLSRFINENILFFYHYPLNLMFVENANYQKYKDQTALKAYPVITTNLETSLESAVWFKDRKGDIFAIHGDTLSLFKFHLKLKKFKQILLKKDQNLLKVKKPESLVYVAQNDIVYYFDSNYFQNSFYFQLYRPLREEKEFSNCLSVNHLHPLLFDTKVKQTEHFYRAIYVLEPKDSGKSKEIAPSIYLLTFKKNCFPLPLCLYRVVHAQHLKTHVQQLISLQGQFEQKNIRLNFENALHTAFKKDSHLMICLLTTANGKITLIEGKILQNNQRSLVQWALYPLSVRFKEIYIDFSCKNVSNLSPKTKNSSDYGLLDQNQKIGVLVSDLSGKQTNNSSKWLAFQPDKNRLVQLCLSLNQGSYQLNIFNLT